MSDNATDPFGDLEGEFKTVEKAEPGMSVGRLPEAVYRVVCSAVDKKGDGKLIDHEIFTSKSGSIGFKLFLEILEPEMVGEVATKGEIHEEVFWITVKNLPYVKRDIATILGRDLESLNELTTIQWAGKTCEISLKDESYEGVTRSKKQFINAWRPEKPQEAASKGEVAF